MYLLHRIDYIFRRGTYEKTIFKRTSLFCDGPHAAAVRGLCRRDKAQEH